MKNPPYHPIHYAYLYHEDIDGDVSYANEEQMELATFASLWVLNVFDNNRSIRVCK